MDLMHYSTPAKSGPGPSVLLGFVIASIDALNIWYGYKPALIPIGSHTAIQRDCIARWIPKTEDLLTSLSNIPPEVWKRSEAAALCSLTSSRVDVLETCGLTDTIDILPSDVVSTITSGTATFPKITIQNTRIPKFSGRTV